MPAIPSIASFTGASVTEGEFKTALSNLHLFLTGLIGTDGTQAGAQAAMGAILGAGSTTKTASYTVDFTDRGKVIACDGSFTVTLPDASAVGSGFAVAIANYGTGTITVDPFSAQTIDGAGTKTLSANTMMVACAVAGEWLSVGGVDAASTSKAGIVQLIDSVTSYSQTLAPTANAARFAFEAGDRAQVSANNAHSAANSAWNNAESRVSKDSGFNNVGSLCFAYRTTSSGWTVFPGDTVEGASLRPSAADGLVYSVSSLSGTWRALGYASSSGSASARVTLYQRIS